MSSLRAIKFKAEPMRTLAFGDLEATYNPIGTPILHPIRELFVQNLTDQMVFISIDGVEDHVPLLSNTAWSVDISANQTFTNGQFFGMGESVYARNPGAASTTGAVYVSAFYASDNF